MGSVKTQMATHETSQQEEVLEHMGKIETVIATLDGTVPGIVGPGVGGTACTDTREKAAVVRHNQVSGAARDPGFDAVRDLPEGLI
ncbi:MAG: hypothetical protein J0H06_10950 [Actinobacteria bacterium]|nr:hypothetical protein [Actinomycetota bacterium]